MKIYGAILLNDILRSMHVFHVKGDDSQEACQKVKQRLTEYVGFERINRDGRVKVRASTSRHEAINGAATQ